jgi:hypothetical protein
MLLENKIIGLWTSKLEKLAFSVLSLEVLSTEK